MSLSARRLAPWLVAAFIIAVGSVAMAVSALPDRPQPQAVHIVQSTDSGFVFGVDYADALPDESESAIGSGLDDAGAVGAGWIRVDLAWYRIQPSPTQWDWRSFDRTVSYAKARGLKVLAILDQPPAWARVHSCAKQIWCPPADDTQFAAFAAQAAQRYPTDVVGAWEVWNEENLGSYWSGGPDPEGYGALLKATSIAMRAVQPRVRIVVGGLAVADSGGKDLSARDFLLDLARSNFLPYASAVGYHPYSFPAAPAAARAFGDISTGPDSLASILDQYQQPSMPIWLTEAGAPVSDAASDPDAAMPATRSQESQQAAYATELVTAATRNSHVRALFWFSDIDLPDQRLYFGLRRADGTARPSLAAFRNAIKAYVG
jgi:hypothetical protein